MTVRREEQVQKGMSMGCLGSGMLAQRREEVELNQGSQDLGPPTPLLGLGFILV